MSFNRAVGVVVVLLMLAATVSAAGETGRIEGRILVEDGSGHRGVAVVLQELSRATLSDDVGNFVFADVPVGTYTVVITHHDEQVSKTIIVTAGQTAKMAIETDWEETFTERLTVYSASRRQERIVEAPAAMTVVTEEDIERQSSHGQVPKLLEFTPGAEVTQSGLYDYNFNTRGFNSSLNRRVQTLIDGRDPSVPFLGAQEWSSVAFPLDDIATMEFVRGPSAALYGANASSGVLNILTKQPKYSEGGLVRFTGGELDTKNVDVRWATPLSRDWYFKVNLAVRDTGDFTVSRMGAAEYSEPCTTPGQTDCLPQEAVPLALENDDEILVGSFRFDKYTKRGDVLTIEGGTSDVSGPVFQTGIGRVQLVDVQRPWARFNYSTDHWNFLGAWTNRNADEQLALSTGGNLVLKSDNYTGEIQTNWDFLGESLRLVAGTRFMRDEISTEKTLTFSDIKNDRYGIFAQLDYQATQKLKFVFAARWDENDLHDSEVSPKASVVYSVTPDHTLRLTYNEAFQVGNYSEYFLQVDVRLPADLSGLQQICGPIDCGFDEPTRIVAMGNETLDLEQVQTWEIGYSAIIADRAYLTLDYYNSTQENFITDLIPQVPSPGEMTNLNIGLWEGPDGLSQFQTDLIRSQAALQLTPLGAQLTNNFDGTNLIAAATYTNIGEVDTQGVDLGLNYYFLPKWNFAFTYSWFDFDPVDESIAFSEQLLPNTPEHKMSGGFGYNSKRFDANLSVRWVDEFRWVVGPFQGQVESYTTADLHANYRLGDRWVFGINVANIFDEEHWQSFGGDLLARRALASVTFIW